MKLFLLLLGFVGVHHQLGAQSVPSPGGVPAPSYWFIADHDPQSSFRSLLPGIASLPLLHPSAQTAYMNFHPALIFAGQQQVNIPITNNGLHRASFFTVYQSTDMAKENIIWHTQKNDSTGLVLTTSRMADLEDYRYINYTDQVPLQPKVSTYVQQKEKDSLPIASQYLSVGNKPTRPDIPVLPLKGVMPELIIYDRVLNGTELSQVSSYLCIKYGITLSEPEGAYLNSKGDMIWDGQSYATYHHNIAGIAKDDSSGLLQTRATSSNNPGQLVIASTGSLRNNNFWLWGDNDKPLSPAERIAGVPPLLEKQWLLVHHGDMDSMVTNLFFDTRQVDAPLPVKPVYWLAIDRSGTNNFSLPGTEYIKMTELDRNKIARFDNIAWRKNTGHKESFTILAGGGLLVSADIKKPGCAAGSNGSLAIRIWGASFPCQLKLYADNNVLIKQRTIDNNEITTISSIAAGRYTVQVTDAAQQQYSDSYYVNNYDGPEPAAVNSVYYLQPGQKQRINAAEGMPAGLSYTWTGPNGFHSLQPDISVSQTGIYTLAISRNGCTYYKEVSLRSLPKNIFTDLLVYPNPSSTGQFGIKLSLDKIAPVTLTIFAEDGRFIKERTVNGFANYTFTEEINTNGLYHLVFRSGLSVQTQKIIILR